MMTPDEHRLIILLVVRQMQMSNTFLEILKSRGVLETGDARAFASLVYQDAAANEVLLSDATKQYLRLAKAAGVVTGLEGPQV